MRPKLALALILLLPYAACVPRPVKPRPAPPTGSAPPAPDASVSVPPPVTSKPAPRVQANPAPRTKDPPETVINVDSGPLPELAIVYEQAAGARAGGRHDEALRLWERIWEADSGFGDVADLLEEEYRVRGLDHFARGEAKEAIRLWEKALRVDPEDRKTQAYLAHALDQQSRLGEISDPGPPGP